MSDAFFSDELAPRAAPIASRSTARIQAAAVPGLLAVGALGTLIVAACLLAIGFCFVGG